MTDVIVIGAGASGLTAAIRAAEAGASVQILEKNDRPGKKLLLTGSGRCNLTHKDPDLSARWHSSTPDMPAQLRRLYKKYDISCTLSFFARLGVLTHDREGYVYPRSDQAASVLNALTGRLRQLDVRLRTGTAVSALEQKDDGTWFVRTEGWQYESRKVILACGSAAAPSAGGSRSGYMLAEQLGHKVISPVPALTGLICKGADLAAAAGARTVCRITLEIPEIGFRASEDGQIQWTKDGISGICVFQLSRYASLALSHGGADDKPTIRAVVDFLPEMATEALIAYLLTQLHRTDRIEELVQGIVPDRIAVMIARRAAKKVRSGHNEDKVVEIAQILKGMTLRVTGVRDFSHAQVCAGGVTLTQIAPETCESQLCPGLYFAGELLDVDGPCGGYNLQWAWSSGMAAGDSAAKACK